MGEQMAMWSSESYFWALKSRGLGLEMLLSWESACLRRRKPWVLPTAPHKPGIGVRARELSTVEAEAGGSEVQAYIHLHSEFEASLHDALFQNKRKRHGLVLHTGGDPETWCWVKEDTLRKGAHWMICFV